MSLFSKLGADVASSVDASGKPRRIVPQDFQTWMTEVEALFGYAFLAGSSVVFPNKADADANLNFNSKTLAWIVTDAVASNNGIYIKNGVSGTGSWNRIADLPYSFIRLFNAGAGTADAIVATSVIPLPVTPSAALLVVNIAASNTGPVTINGKPLVTVSGNALTSGNLAEGMFVAFLDTGSQYRLLSDVASASDVAAAQAARVGAEGCKLSDCTKGGAGRSNRGYPRRRSGILPGLLFRH